MDRGILKHAVIPGLEVTGAMYGGMWQFQVQGDMMIMAQIAEIHSINNCVVFGRCCGESTMPVKTVGYF